MIYSVNLSVSSICGARCIYCPDDKGCAVKDKFMSFSLFKKIIQNLVFSSTIKPSRIIFGENGDCFLNKDIIKMLRYTRKHLPNIRIVLYTNFQNFKKEYARIINKEHLVDLIRTNIDGYNTYNYFAVKKLNMAETENNILQFIRLRWKYSSNIPIYISVLTLNRYITSIKNNFGFYPLKVKDINNLDIKDDYQLIKEKYDGTLWKEDKIFRIYGTFGWAERKMFDPQKINYKKYACPNLIRIEHEAFIAPDGTWYACCFDSANELKFGNLQNETFEEIYNGERRQAIIKILNKHQFNIINGPCKTVNCCQILSKHKFISNIYRLLFKSKIATNLLYLRYNMDK